MNEWASVWMKNRKCNKNSELYDAENGKFVWDWFQIYCHREEERIEANLREFEIKKWDFPPLERRRSFIGSEIL